MSLQRRCDRCGRAKKVANGDERPHRWRLVTIALAVPSTYYNAAELERPREAELCEECGDAHDTFLKSVPVVSGV